MNDLDLTVFIQRSGDELVTDSRAVAVAFKKKHAHVLRDIKGMLNSKRPEIAEHARSNFGSCSYTDQSGRERPMYRLTQKGFAELAMSYSGEESRVVRIRFLNAFEAVSARLASAEKSITQMLHDFEKRAIASEAKGSIGSMLMHGRRKEKPALKDEEALLKEAAQPSLLLVAGPKAAGVAA